MTERFEKQLGEFVRLVRETFRTDDFIPLHEPRFWGREEEYVLDCIRSTFVSSVGCYVDRFEQDIAAITGARFAVATTNGTAALQVALRLAGVAEGDLVVTQPLTFVATGNAIVHQGAGPAFVDVERETLGLDPDAVERFLRERCRKEGAALVHCESGRRVAACVPMHTFGHPARIERLVEVCEGFGVPVVEDAAESLGSTVAGRHTGTFGVLGILSFNGNKTVTAGGGGAILTDDDALARRAKHLTTTAKIPHRWAFEHDEVGYNYRMPNLNAALLCAQLEQLETFLAAKRRLAEIYEGFLAECDWEFVREPEGTHSNYWLSALLVDPAERKLFLQATNDAHIMTRPAWAPLHGLPMFRDAPRDPLPVAESLAARLVNVPSSALRHLAR